MISHTGTETRTRSDLIGAAVVNFAQCSKE